MPNKKVNIAPVMRLNKRAIDSLPIPDQRVEYRDEMLSGFRLRIEPTGRKTFYIVKKHKSKVHKVMVGTYPDMTPEQARAKGAHVLSEIAHGLNPNIKRKAEASASVTLQEALDNYLTRNKSLKASTKYDYRKKIERVFPKQLERPLSSLTRDVVIQVHTAYSKQSPSVADSAMRALRAIHNFAAGEYVDENGVPLFPDNPTKEISRLKAWSKQTRRKTLIRKHQLPHWFSAVLDLPNLYPTPQAPIVRDLFLTLLFTGLRRNEAARLQVDDVDFSGKTILVRETKNGEPHELPIGDYLASVLAERKREAVNGWLFPDRHGNGPIKTFTKAHQAVKDASGVDFIAHDLRRTFITLAESLDFSRYTLKRLLNHSEGDDVTGGYMVLDVERLRTPMTTVESLILSLVGIKPAATILPIRKFKDAES
jgi:integrase